MGHASFLLDELLYSIGPDDGSDQVALVRAGILLLHRLLSSAKTAELVELHGSYQRSVSSESYTFGRLK